MLYLIQPSLCLLTDSFTYYTLTQASYPFHGLIPFSKVSMAPSFQKYHLKFQWEECWWV